MAHIKKTNSGKWKAIVEIGKNPITGKRKRKTKTFELKRDAQAWQAEIIGRARKGSIIKKSDKTLKEAALQWLKSKRNLSETTNDSYEQRVNTHIIPELGNIKLKNLTADIIDDFFNEKEKNGNKTSKSKGLSPSTLNKIYNCLSQTLDKAEGKYINNNPMENVEKPKPQDNDIDPLNKTQLEKLIHTAKSEGDDWMYNFINVAAFTGMRKSELLGLRWRDVDLERGYIRVSQVLVRKTGEGTILKSPKSKSSKRLIKINDKLVNILKDHKKREEEFKSELGPKYQYDLDLVFSKDDGSKYYPTTVNRRYNHITKVANLDRFTIHDLRHTHATLLLKANKHPKIVQERLGHSSVRITLDIYSHYTTSMQDELAKSIEEIME